MRDPRHAPILPELQLITAASSLCGPPTPHGGWCQASAGLADAPVPTPIRDDAQSRSLRTHG